MTIKAMTLGEFLAMPDPLAGKVIVEDNYIIIRDEYEFDISLDDCNTQEKLMSWLVYFLVRKDVDREIIYRFYTTACKENNLKRR